MNQFEQEYVKKSYENIADDFDKTRYYCWTGVKRFIDSLPPNSKILDAGCGNGRNMMLRNDVDFTGVDTCEKLVEICRNKNLNTHVADIRNLPFAPNSFDALICVAVLGHVSNYEDRLAAINECVRVVRPGGKIFFQLWSTDAIGRNKIPNKFQPINDKNDYFVLWGDMMVKRYYHLFDIADTTEMFGKISNINKVSIYHEKCGIIVEIEKK